MLRLGPPYYSFEGVTVMGDAHDPVQHYYYPNAPHVPVGEDGIPIIRFLALREAMDTLDAGDDGEVAGFLFFDTVLTWPEQTLAKVKDEVEKAIEEDTGVRPEIRLAPLPYRRGGVQLTFLDETTERVVLDPPENDGADSDDDAPPVEEEVSDWVSFLQTSGTPSLYGENRAVFSAELTRKATQLMFGAFDGLIPASVFYELEFVGQMQAYNVRVEADWDQVYNFIQENRQAGFLFFRKEVDDITTELIDTRVINITSTLDLTDPDTDPDALQAEFQDVRSDLQDMVLETFFEPITNPNEVEPNTNSTLDNLADSFMRIHTLASGWPSVGHTRRELTAEQRRSIQVDYSTARAVRRRIYPQAHVNVLFDELGLTRDDLVRIVDGDDDMWRQLPFRATCEADFAGSNISRVVLDVQYVKDTDFDASLEGEGGGIPADGQLWSFMFETGEEVFEKATWFDPEIGARFFYRYRIFFDPAGMPGPTNSVSSAWTQIQSRDIVVDAAKLFEREDVVVQTVGSFPWDRYPEVLLRLRYNDPQTTWLHEDAKMLRQDDGLYEGSFRQRPRDGIEPEYALTYLRDDGEVIETAWQPVDAGLTVIPSPDPDALEIRFVLSPATELGLLILDLTYADPDNNLHESHSIIFTPDDRGPHIWRIPWKDPTKRRYMMNQTIIRADDSIVQTGAVEAEGPTQVVGDTFAMAMKVEPKLVGPDLAGQGVDKVLLHLRYEDAQNGVSHEMLHEFNAPGDGPPWSIVLKDASLRDYIWEMTFQMTTGFTRRVGPTVARDRFLVLSSELPS
ncbi:MAG: hypothetical protein AAGE03_04065 [Pseudomonadota bacterium]